MRIIKNYMIFPPKPQDETARLDTLAEYAILDTDSEERFDRITRMVSSLLNTPIASIALVAEDHIWFKSKIGFEAKQIDRDASFCGHTILQDELFIVEDAQLDARFHDNPFVINPPFFRAYAGMPLQVANYKKIGALCVVDTKPRIFSEEEKRLLRDLAAIVVDAFEHRLAFRQSLREKVKSESISAVLCQSEAKYKAILDNAVDGIILIKKNGIIEAFNIAAERIFGYQAQEVIGKNVSMLMPEPYRSQHDGYLTHYLNSHIPKIIGTGREVQGLRKNGSIFPMRLAVSDIAVGAEQLFSGMVHDMSEVHAAQEAVKSSGNLLRSMIDASPEPIFVKNLEGHYILLNQASASVIQRSIKEVLNKTDEDLFPAALAQEIRNLDLQVLVTQETVQIEENIPNREGVNRTYIVTKSPFYDANGHLSGIVTTAKDISERKQMEARLIESERRLILSQRFANIGTWDWNLETDAFYWSDRIPLLLGYSTDHETPSFQRFINAVHPKDKRLVENAIQGCIYQNTEYNVKHRVIWEDESIHWLHQRGDVIRDESGKALRMLGLVQDITQFTEAQQMIAAKEARYRAIVDDQTELLCRFDLEGRLTFVNKAYAAYFNRPIQSLIGQYFYTFLPPKDSALIKQVIQELTYENPVITNEHHVISGTGELRWMQWTKRAIFDEDHHIIEYQSFGIDTTDRKLAEENIQAAKEAADKANQAKSEFLSSMSHELRTPLNAILGFAQLLNQSRKDPLSEKQKKHIQHIIKAGKHLLDLINEILDLAKIEAGRVSLSIEKVDISHIVTECLTLVDALTSQNAIQLINLVPNTPVFILADYMRLKQVLLNLLSNAIKYNKTQGSVTICTYIKPTQLECSIQDTGKGIPYDMQDKLFEPFWRLDPDQTEIEGTGIGLTITKKLVEHMNGQIWFESVPDQGSTFWIALPLANESMLSTNTIENSSESTDDMTLLGALSILYIEDNPANILLMQEIFEEYPEYRLFCEKNAIDGIAQAKILQPDLIIMDINMPEMNGIEAVSQLKLIPETAHIPVIALSANVMEQTVQAGLKAGFLHYLPKPVDIQKLMNIIYTIFQKD